MKKTLLVLGLIALVGLPFGASGQMMGYWDQPVATTTPEDYQALGQQWMQNMMGPNYDSYSKEMREVMGDSIFGKMQEAAGKSWAEHKGYLWTPMMGWYGYGTSTCGWGAGESFAGFRNMMNGTFGDMHGKSWWLWPIAIFGVLMMLVAIAIPIAVLVLIAIFIAKLVKSLRK